MNQPSGAPALLIGIGQPKGGAGASSLHDQIEQRFRAMTPDEHMTLSDGVTPEAANLLMKLMPELGDIIEKVMNETGAPDAGDPNEAAENEPPHGGSMPPPRPKTMLGQV